MTFLITFFLSSVMSLMFTPAVISIARRRGWYDPVDERKIHTDQTPRLGGLAIALSFFISMPVSLIIIEALAPGKVHISASLLVLFSAGIGFHLLGLVDDFKSLGGRIKFVVQIFLAVVIVSAGYYFRVVEIPVAPFRVELGFVGPVLTVIWIVGIVNAMNLIDGMDGLSGGLAIIGAVVWAMVYIKIGQYLPALVALAFTGAILGFLFFNFPPAAVFMGDSGSLFLGFILAILPLLGRIRSPMQTGLLPAITICFIPLLDTLAAIIRRWRRGVSFFTADRYHLHHKLLNIGFTVREILAIIYGLSSMLGLSVVITIYVNPVLGFWLMMVSWFVIIIVFTILHFFKEKDIRMKRRDAKEAAIE